MSDEGTKTSRSSSHPVLLSTRRRWRHGLARHRTPPRHLSAGQTPTLERSSRSKRRRRAWSSEMDRPRPIWACAKGLPAATVHRSARLSARLLKSQKGLRVFVFSRVQKARSPSFRAKVEASVGYLGRNTHHLQADLSSSCFRPCAYACMSSEIRKPDSDGRSVLKTVCKTLAARHVTCLHRHGTDDSRSIRGFVAERAEVGRAYLSALEG